MRCLFSELERLEFRCNNWFQFGKASPAQALHRVVSKQSRFAVGYHVTLQGRASIYVDREGCSDSLGGFVGLA